MFDELTLNEVFAAEKDVSSCSVFRVKLDADEYIGKFKSSGILISSGTGSTGWVHSARKFTEMDIHRALVEFGMHDENELVRLHLAESLSNQNVFDHDMEKMFYYVREASSSSVGDEFEGPS